jgi:NitT/TauT family transport system ATP-binding protein
MEASAAVKNVPLLEVRGLSKDFADIGSNYVVFNDISFTVPENEFVCLLGSSGCGKTTLLRILMGLTDASRGEVLIDDKPIKGPGQDRSIVFQNYGLLPWRTVIGNVELGLEIRGVPRSKRRPICQQYIDTVGLKGFENRYPHQISGGMQQRVALARAFSKKPRILLMDEPFAAVDMQTREKLQDELLSIWNDIKTTVVFVTHSIDEAIYLADRVIVMAARPGRIAADLRTDLERPRSGAKIKSSHRFSELRELIRAAIATDAKE